MSTQSIHRTPSASESVSKDSDCIEISLAQEPKSKTVEPPDGGYGWVIVAAAFVGHGSILYNARAVGVLLLDLKNEFETPYANLNILFSLLIGCIYIAAPIVSIFGNRFGSRATAIVGGLLQFIGICGAAFSKSMAFTHIFLGLITGLGLSFSAMPLSVEVGRYFSKRRSLALGVQQIGPSVFQMISPPITQYLIDCYGWRGALLITGALNLNVVACGAALRPIHLKSDSETKDEKGKKKLLDMSIFRSKKFIMYTVTLSILSPSLFIMGYYLVAYAKIHQGFSEYEAVFLLTLSAIFSLAARPITGFIESYTRFTCFTMMTLLSGTTALCYLIYPFLKSYWMSSIIQGIFAFGVGGISPMMISGLTDIVGPSRLMSAFGIQGISGAATSMLTQPFVGWLSDVFETLSVVMWTGFVLMTISTILLLIYCFVFHSFVNNLKKSSNK
uniref:monocarboxylate transporter 2-like n=1 Tax=Styela clava TaxID=7725 RepID=UPI001939F235|nr:monocarboxylate transporter 2-like [Styela clava]